MEYKICVPIVEKSRSDFAGRLADVQKIVDFIELRADFIRDMQLDYVGFLKKKTFKESIFACRRRRFGGNFFGSSGECLRIFEKADQAGFDFIDVDIGELEFNEFIPKKAKLIASFHDFESTPSLSELERIHRKMKRCSPTLFKFATFCRDKKDADTLMEFLKSKENPEKFVICGMGEFGKKTRVLALQHGAAFGFASLYGEGSASGQLDYFEMIRQLAVSDPPFFKSSKLR